MLRIPNPLGVASSPILQLRVLLFANDETEIPKISEKDSFSAPDSFAYTKPAELEVSPWVISCPVISKSVSGVKVVPFPSP